MNISKLLLIDAVLAIAATPLIFLINGKHKTYNHFRSTNKEALLEKRVINLPNKKELLDLDKLARSEGRGIDLESLFGDWNFVSIWKKDAEDEDYFFSSLLRVFSAKLQLKKEIPHHNQPGFIISVLIQFGLFSIKFSGSGYLKGKQPSIVYFFNLIEFKSGSSVLLRRLIKEPKENEKPFFALIATDECEGWLSARGPGDSLIVWLKD